MIKPAEAVLVIAALSATALAAQERAPERAPERYSGSVSFRGNRYLDELILAASISTSPSSWTFKWFRLGDRRRWDDVEFRRDVIRLQLLYRQHGFYEARVDTVVDRRDHLIDPTFIISEGAPVVVDTITITGIDSVRGAAGLARLLPLQAGRPFDRFLFEASADSLTFWIRNRGYPWAEVFRNYTVDRRGQRARASFDILTGPRSVIGAIQVQGNVRIRERTVRRQLTVREGDPYNQNALFESQRGLYQSELFRYASVGVAPDSVVGGVDSLVRLRVQVAEATPVQLRAGFGYGTVDCIRTSGSMSVLNFAGEARRLDVLGRISKIGVGRPLHFGLEHSICPELANDQFSSRINYLASVTLTQPIALLSRSAVSLSTFGERRSEFNAYLVESFGGSLGYKFGFGRRRVPISITYRMSRDQTTAAPATYCVYFNQCDPASLAPFAAPQRKASLSLSIVNTRTDSPIEPTRGHVWSFEATSAAPWLGSEIVFDRVIAEAVNYAPLHGMVLSARIRGGIIRQGRSTIGGNSLRYVTPPDRFYAGGPTTVRGFARNEMGPQVYVADTVLVSGTDTTLIGLRSSPTGSSAMLLANAELRVPTPLFARRIAINLFADGGELWDYTGASYVPGGLKITPGMGIQVSTPLGPMRVDAAYNGYRKQPGRLYVINGTQLDLVDPAFAGQRQGGSFWSHLQWHFNVGLAF